MGGSKKRGPNPDRARVLAQARGLVDAGRPAEAETLLRRGLPSPSRDAEGLRLRARIAELEGRPADMKSLAEKSLRIESHSDGHLILAQFHLRQGDVEPARAEAARAVEIDPADANARLMHAAILLEAGRIDDAEATITPLRDAPPDDAGLGRRLGYTVAAIRTRRGDHQSALDHLDAEVITPAASPPERKAALALRARILDHLGRFDEAFADAEAFNALERVDFSPGLYDRDIDRMIERNGRDRLERFPTGFPSELPVLVSGMPRSGTSLVDRIIDAHPDAAGAGEFTGLERFAANEGVERRGLVPESFAAAPAPRAGVRAELLVPVPVAQVVRDAEDEDDGDDHPAEQRRSAHPGGTRSAACRGGYVRRLRQQQRR